MNRFNISMRRVVAAAIIGNALEIYDMVIYGLLATTIAENFFPKQDKLTGIASVFGVFFIGYLARPLGALFFGRMGDNFGRKPALLASISLMAVSTCAVGLLPNYAAIGMWATLLLLVFRLLQGFSCGGELIGSIIFVIEHAPRARRGFYGSLSAVGESSGLLLASFIAWLIYNRFSDAAVINWAWRLPFLLGVLIGFVGWFMRRRIPETELFQQTIRMPQHYLKQYREYANQIPRALLILSIVLFGVVLSYLIYFFFVTCAVILQYTTQQATSINILSIILLVFLEPWMGKLSDRIGRRPVIALALIGCVIWIWPYFWLLQQHNVALALLAQCVMTLFAAAYFAMATVITVEIVPVHLRFTVVALTYAIAGSLFGGITPLLATLLIKTTHSYYGLALYLSVCAIISAIAVYKVRETKYRPN